MYVLNGFHAAFLKLGRQAFQQPLGGERTRKSRQIGGTRDYVAVVAVNLINQSETVIAFEIINGLHTIGLEAIVITLAAVLGSVTAAWALWYVLYKRNKEGQV